MKRMTINDRLRNEAKRAMWMYYKEHKSRMPTWIREYREEIIEGIQTGMTPEEVFNEIIDQATEDPVAKNAA